MGKELVCKWEALEIKIRIRYILLLIILLCIIVASIKSCKRQKGIQIGLQDKNGIIVEDAIHKVYIDPGHGGDDPGTEGLNYDTIEKDLALKVGLALNDLLLKENYQTYMTRVDDSTVKIWDRPKMANETDAEILVSLHFNAAETQISKTSGIETFYYENTKSDSPELAKYIHAELIKGLKLRDRGIKGEDHCVTRETTMPAILVELGFLTNKTEEAFYLKEENLNKAAECVRDGILKYFEEKERSDNNE